MDADAIALMILVACLLVIALIVWALCREETHDDGYYFEDSEENNDKYAKKPHELP